MEPMTHNELRRLRRRLGWTQDEAAKKIKVSLRTWARWEAGTSTISEAVAFFMRTRAARVRK